MSPQHSRSASTSLLGQAARFAFALACLFVVFSALPDLAAASSSGVSELMGPWETVQGWLTGPIGKAAGTIMLIVGGLVWGFSGSKKGGKMVGQAIVATALVVGAASLMDQLGFGSALM